MARISQTLAVLFGALLACHVGAATDRQHEQAENKPEKPVFVPLPASAPEPEDNRATDEKVALGKQLFFDPRLSGDNKMSCATCHIPEKGFGDGRTTAKGRDGKNLPRNSQTVLNVGFHSSFFWDGRARSLEEQALVSITSPDEMHQDLDELEKELQAVEGYARQFREVFNDPVTRGGIARALAAFQRTLIARDSPFDRFLAGDEDAISDDAKRGFELFRGSAGCARCHHGPAMSDGKFYRLGASWRDNGRGEFTGKPEDDYRFRTPPLRNIAQTGPYMHDGSLATLQDVVDYYNRGGFHAYGIDPLIRPLGLEWDEQEALIAFLRSLTSDSLQQLIAEARGDGPSR